MGAKRRQIYNLNLKNGFFKKVFHFIPFFVGHLEDENIRH